MTVVVQNNVIQAALSSGQGPAGRPPEVDITDITYDGTTTIVTGYTLNGEVHVVTYPDANTIVDTGGGSTKTTILDGLGRPISCNVS
jgi:hypothetical protein